MHTDTTTTAPTDAEVIEHARTVGLVEPEKAPAIVAAVRDHAGRGDGTVRHVDEDTAPAPDDDDPFAWLARTLGRNLRVLRRARGWTRTDALAAWQTATGQTISLDQWGALERGHGRRTWTADRIARVMATFAVLPHEFMQPMAACDHCDDAPPPGYRCTECGAKTPR
ncbi:hypothetical protein ACSMX9_22695 [Streptomyces sp. LE64]|uniref:hypothetical protein n=1 Tax=Streptomyces sp. LE64 TaxID=3448653 RepID=UPI0040424FBB